MFQFSKTSKERMAGVDARLIQVMEEAIKLSPIDFGIPEHGGLRTAEEQHSLYLNKASEKDGYVKKSYHQSGKALDVFAYVNGKNSWDEGHLTTIATAVLQAANSLGYKVEWGGLWKDFVDMPHFQIRD